MGDVETMWENCDRFNKKSQPVWKVGRRLTGLLRGGIMEIIQSATGKSRKRKIYDDDEDEAEWDDEDEDDESPVKNVTKKRGSRTFAESDDSEEEEEEVVASSRSGRRRRGAANYDDEPRESKKSPKRGRRATRRSGRGAAAAPDGKKTKQNLFGEGEGEGPESQEDYNSEEFVENMDESEPESDEGDNGSGRRRRSGRTATTTSTTSSSRARGRPAKKRTAGKRKRSINGDSSDSDDDSNDGMTNAARRISAPAAARSPKPRAARDPTHATPGTAGTPNTPHTAASSRGSGGLDLTKITSKRTLKSLGTKILKKFREKRCPPELKGIFERDPTKELAGYAKRIKRPMWYFKIESRLQASSYKHLKLVKNDVEQIFANAMEYNQEETAAYEFASELIGRVDEIVEGVVRGDGEVMKEYFM